MDHERRRLLGSAATTVAEFRCRTFAGAQVPRSDIGAGPVKHIDAGLLGVGFFEAGPATGPVAILLQAWPDDIDSFGDVMPHLAAPKRETAA